MSLTRHALERPHAVLVLALLAAVLGVFGLLRTPTDLFPDTAPPQVAVVTVYPGASASDVDGEVTQLLERELASVAGLVRVRSVSRDEVSSVTAEFRYEKPVGEAVVDVQTAVARVRGSLPAQTEEPRLYRITDATRPLLTLAVSPAAESLKSLAGVRLLAENQLRDALLAVPGVADVQVFGGRRPEVSVRVDREALAARGITLGEVVARLAQQNVSAPVGTVYGSASEYLVRVQGQFRDPAEIEALPLRSSSTSQIRLGDVARVALADADPRSAYHGNGRPAVALNVLRAEGGHTVAAIRAVKEALPGIEAHYPDLVFELADDQEPLIALNTRGMRSSLWQAVALTVAVIFLFLGNARAASVASVSIPLSFLAALAVLWFSPYTLNMVTMSGLIVAVGMVVDASVVVLENVYRHRAAGSGAREASEAGTREVALAITAGMLTTVVVLVPVLFTHGYTARIMRPLNVMIIVTLVASLVASLTVVPALAARLLGESRGTGRLERLTAPVGRALDRVTDGYVVLVDWGLRHRGVFLLGCLLFLLLTMGVVRPLLGGEQMPPMDTGIAIVEFDAPSSSRPDEVEAALSRVEAVILETPGVRRVSSTMGSEPDAISFGSGATVQSARITVHLTPRTERRETIWEIQAQWRERLRGTAGVQTFRVAEYGATPVSTTRAPLDVILSGPDPRVLDRLADEVLARLRPQRGLLDLRRSWHTDKAEQVVVVSPELARLHGTSPAEVAVELQAAVRGIPATRLRLAEFLDIPVRVRYRAEQMADPAHLEGVYVPTELGPVTVAGLARIEGGSAPPFLTREDLQPTVNVTAGNTVLTIAEVAEAAEARLADLPLPRGYAIQVAGTARDMAESQGELGRALTLGLALLFLLLVALFRSFLHPLAILGAVPLAVAGALWGLLLFDKPMCMPALMGIILLGGTVVNNAILLLDFIVEARRAGTSRDEAVLQSVRLRVRPILMTALSTVVGFTPLIFEMAVGLERMSPLGVAAATGLLFGTVITTVAVPVLYSALDSLSSTLSRGSARARRAALAALCGAVVLSPAPSQAVVGLSSPLTLEAAVAFALAHSPELEAARAEAELLEGVARGAEAHRRVAAELSAGGGWYEEPHGMIPGAFGKVQRADRWLFQTEAQARYLLWDFGRSEERLRSALARADAAGLTETRQRQHVTFQVSRLFLASLAVDDLLEPAKASRRSLEALAAATERLADEGLVPAVDRLKVRVKLAQVESRIAALEGDRRSLRAALAATLGAEGELPPLVWAEPAAEGRRPEEPRDGTALRPDVAARRTETAAAAGEVEAARRDRLPRLEVRASYSLYAAPDPRPAFPGGEDRRWEDDAFVGLQLTVPLLDGGLRDANLRQARARAEAARAALRRARLEAAREVSQAEADLDRARAEIAANQAAADEAGEAARIERLKYGEGRGTVNDVLEAEAALLDAEGRLRAARREAEVARLALDLALGRGPVAGNQESSPRGGR
ncbi:MAG: efflux RND transporter permease subunit [Deferrisomatales bacterium]